MRFVRNGLIGFAAIGAATIAFLAGSSTNNTDRGTTPTTTGEMRLAERSSSMQADAEIDALSARIDELERLVLERVEDQDASTGELEGRLDILESLVGHGSNLTGVRGCVRVLIEEQARGGRVSCPDYMR